MLNQAPLELRAAMNELKGRGRRESVIQLCLSRNCNRYFGLSSCLFE